MPRLSVWMVRVALAYLVTGFALGAIMLTQRAHPFLVGAAVPVRALHIELLTLGWTVNLGIGVGYWILPRHAKGAERGSAAMAALAFGLLNAGVIAVGTGAAFGAPASVLVAGRLAEAAAAAAFALHAWGRIKPYGAGRTAS